MWDVLQSCEREGSLDSAIDPASVQPNDFAGFFAAHPRIGTVLCNGSTAFTLFTRRVLPTLPPPWAALPCLRMPSTSPAHAGLSRAAKLQQWIAALRQPLADANG